MFAYLSTVALGDSLPDLQAEPWFTPGDPLPARKPLFLDNAGEVRTGFHDLQPARSYGVGWQPAP